MNLFKAKPKKSAMKRTKEVLDFESGFPGKVMEIHAVTGAGGFSGGKSGSEEYWTAGITLTAWKEAGGGELHTGETQLCDKADDGRMDELRGMFGPDSVIAAKVRRGGRGFLLVERLEPPQDPQLDEHLKKQTAEVFYQDDVLGKFELNRNVNWFEAEQTWMGKKISLNFDQDGEEAMQAALAVAHKLFAAQEEWDGRLKERIAQDLLELKNESWLDEGEEALTEREFLSKVSLESVSVDSEGGFTFWYGDGDLFWGHSIMVEGTLENGPESADIAG